MSLTELQVEKSCQLEQNFVLHSQLKKLWMSLIEPQVENSYQLEQNSVPHSPLKKLWMSLTEPQVEKSCQLEQNSVLHSQLKMLLSCLILCIVDSFHAMLQNTEYLLYSAAVSNRLDLSLDIQLV